MARASGAAKRIDLILDEGRKLSGSVPMGASAFIGLAGMPLLYLASSINLAQASPAPQAPDAPRVNQRSSTTGSSFPADSYTVIRIPPHIYYGH